MSEATYKIPCNHCHKLIAQGINRRDAESKAPPETQWINNLAYCSRACLNEERAAEAAMLERR